mgnify:CR=1 FL=1|tara:strand:+ start:47 stop:505 length:459 start_codon:yes stop_codon:yes gene_type:complete
MTKKEILKKCDSYIELFKDSKNVERDNILEFLDFAYLHLPDSSNLAFEINQLKSEKFSEHANRIKEFINTNGSKSMKEKKNFLSDKSTFELLGILLAIGIFGFGIGYWTKNFEVFSVVTQSEKLISLPSVNSTENISDEKDKIRESENSKNE